MAKKIAVIVLVTLPVGLALSLVFPGAGDAKCYISLLTIPIMTGFLVGTAVFTALRRLMSGITLRVVSAVASVLPSYILVNVASFFIIQPVWEKWAVKAHYHMELGDALAIAITTSFLSTVAAIVLGAGAGRSARTLKIDRIQDNP